MITTGGKAPESNRGGMGLKEFWNRHKAEIGLAILAVYTLSLGVATADELFHLGLFPTKLDKMIAEAIADFDNSDPRAVQQALRDVREYGDFAVPQLIGALDGKAPRNLVIQSLKAITSQDFAEPEKWKEWYRNHQEDY